MDEADKLFEDGTQCFRDQLEIISKACTNEKLHRAMFSATNTPAVTKWCRHNLKGLATVTVGHRFILFLLMIHYSKKWYIIYLNLLALTFIIEMPQLI